MAKLKVFISYSHHNTETRLALESEMRSRFDLRCDCDHSQTPALHKEISANINWSDVVVPIITADWLKSHECRDELVRAHERRKTIIPFQHQSVGDSPLKVPWYLREALYISWTGDQIKRGMFDLIAALDEVYTEVWRATCLGSIRLLGDDLHNAKDAPLWKGELCRQILNIARLHVRDIMATDRCSFDIAHEHAYLRFADPIFRQASHIVAICIASISTFWSNPHFSRDAGQYLANQRKVSESICRLFVFESISEALLFSATLKRHFDVYGKNSSSGVFVCSTATYKRLLSNWFSDPELRSLRQDFGLLTFQGEQQGMHARLNESEFRYFLFEQDDPSITSERAVLECFRRLATLEPGKTDPITGISRWSPECLNSSEALAASLERLFTNTSKPVTHFVALKPREDSDELAKYIETLVARFHRQREEMKIRNVSFMRRADLRAVDGRYQRPLRIYQEFDYLLMMDFDDDHALQYYYQHELHSIQREELYKLLDPAIRTQFDRASRIDPSQLDAKGSVFREIEEYMTTNGFVRRFDVRDCESLACAISRLDIGAAGPGS